MACSTMPASVGRGSKNHVPCKRPTHCPDGHHRCPECNALVRDGSKCGCEERRKDVPYSRQMRITWQEPDRARYEVAQKAEGKKTWRTKYVFERKPQEPRTYTCQECGETFESGTMGRPPKWCPRCRHERQRAAWRRKNEKRRKKA